MAATITAASTPKATPPMTEWVTSDPATAANAATRHMPSTEMLSVPARSATHSPEAAKARKIASRVVLPYSELVLKISPTAERKAMSSHSRAHGGHGSTPVTDEKDRGRDEQRQDQQRLHHID